MPNLADPSDEFGTDGSFGFSPTTRADGTPAAEPHLPQPKWYKDFAVDELQTTDLSLAWLPEDRSSGKPDGANGFTGGTIAYKRANGWASITNFGADPAALPAGKVLLTSGPLTEDGLLPQDMSAWIQLR